MLVAKDSKDVSAACIERTANAVSVLTVHYILTDSVSQALAHNTWEA